MGGKLKRIDSVKNRNSNHRKGEKMKTLYKLLAIVMVLGLMFGFLPKFSVEAATSEIIYDAVPDPLPPNMASLGYQATQTSEFGDYIQLAGTNRLLKTVTVTMSTWALESTYFPLLDGGDSWQHPITLNIYEGTPGTPNVLGTLISTKTQTFDIPWRPEADPTCSTTTAWKASDGNCYNGYAFNITFDFSGMGVVLPDDIIIGVAYNTNTWGYDPIGLNGPYESLNVGVEGALTIGSDVATDNVFWNTATASWYTDGGAAGVGIFREDTNWTPYGTLPFQITADPVPVPCTTDCYVSPTGDDLNFGNEDTPFLTIQAAINAVSAGGTVHVAAGTYLEMNVLINKSVTLTGDPGDAAPGTGPDAPVIDGQNQYGDAFKLAKGVSHVTIEGFEVKNFITNPVDGFDGVGNAISAWVGSTSYITVRDNYFHDLEYNGILVGNDKSSDPTKWSDHTNWLVSNNVIENTGYIGVELTNTSNSIIENNEIHLNIPYISAIFSSARRNESDLTIRNNYIDGTPSAAYPVIYVYAYDLDMDNPNLDGLLIEGNTIVTDPATPYQVYIRNIGTGTVTNVKIEKNGLRSLKNLTSATIDASPNWWGAVTGPTTSQYSGDVIYIPWCTNEACTTFGYPPVHNVTQDTYFYTIQSAVSAASSNDVIEVAAGNYVEVGQIVIDKNLTIIGADKSSTIIKPAQSTGASGDARGWWLVQSGVTFNLSDVTLDGEGYLVNIGILSHGSGTIENNILKNIGYNPSGPTYAGRGIAIYDANMTIKDNYLTNIGRIGIYFYGSGVTAGLVDGNTYVGKGEGDWLDYGVEIEGGAVVEVQNNNISDCVGIASVDGSGSAGLLITTYFADGSTANIHDNTFTNNDIAIYAGYNDTDTSSVIAEYNKFVGNDYGVVSTGPSVDASPNWWNDVTGPILGDKTYGPVTFVKWCGDEDCNFFLPEDDGVVELGPGTINLEGGIEINQPHLTILLKDGTIIQNDSPCFIVNASYTTITTESIGGAKCIPTDGANGIDVAVDLENIVIEGLEITKGATATGDGIHFDGVVTDTVLVDNWIHGLDGNGIFFGGEPVGLTEGAVDIHGNLFQDNAGNGIEAGTFAVPAEYNSWGDVAGAAAGDGASEFVDTDPYTHVDLYLVSSGTPWANQVVEGDQITYAVKAHMVYVNAADFVLTYDSSLLSVADVVPGTDFVGLLVDDDPLTYEALVDASVPGELHFSGFKMDGTVDGDVTLFTVTFDADDAGTSALNFVEATDLFGMPAAGSSENIYAAALTDGSVKVIELPTIEIVLMPEGSPDPCLAGLPCYFQLHVTNPALGMIPTAPWYVNFTAPTGAVIEFNDEGTWVEITSPWEQGGVNPGVTVTPTFRITFLDPGVNTLTVELMDPAPDPDFMLDDDTQDFTTLGNFSLTGTFSMQGRTARAGIPVTLTWGETLVSYAPAGSTIEQISNNLLMTLIYGGGYTVTTNQPRYLNVTASLGKVVSVFDATTMARLELKGGNAIWTDNEIDIFDAVKVGSTFGLTGDGDVNFDGKINIQDLALVGGNYSLTSADAYEDWTP